MAATERDGACGVSGSARSSMTDLYKQCDFHIHTRLSACALPEMHVRAIVEACAKRGIRWLGLADHVAVGTDTSVLATSRRELAEVRTQLEVFVGCELDILGVGRHLGVDAAIAELDFICVAANHFHDPAVDRPKGDSLEAVGRHFIEMFRYACSLEFADFVAHPLYVYPGTFDPTCLELITDEEIVDCLSIAKQNDIAMEISPRALDPAQLFFRMRFLKMCKQAGLRFAIGSDAHRLEMAGSTEQLAPIVRDLNLTDEDIWLPRGASHQQSGILFQECAD